MAARARGPEIAEDDAWENVPEPAAALPAARPPLLKDATEALEREMIGEALAATRNNQMQAARRLGLSRQGLINKIKRYGL